MLVIDLGCTLYMLPADAYNALGPTTDMQKQCPIQRLAQLDFSGMPHVQSADDGSITCTGIAPGLFSNVSACALCVSPAACVSAAPANPCSLVIYNFCCPFIVLLQQMLLSSNHGNVWVLELSNAPNGTVQAQVVSQMTARTDPISHHTGTDGGACACEAVTACVYAHVPLRLVDAQSPPAAVGAVGTDVTAGPDGRFYRFAAKVRLERCFHTIQVVLGVAWIRSVFLAATEFCATHLLRLRGCMYPTVSHI